MPRLGVPSGRTGNALRLVSIAAVGVLLGSCGPGVSRVSLNAQPTSPPPPSGEAAVADFNARNYMANRFGTANRIDASLGCVSETVSAYNSNEAARATAASDAEVPITAASDGSAVWVCDFKGSFGYPGKLQNFARVVVISGSLGQVQYRFFPDQPPSP